MVKLKMVLFNYSSKTERYPVKAHSPKVKNQAPGSISSIMGNCSLWEITATEKFLVIGYGTSKMGSHGEVELLMMRKISMVSGNVTMPMESFGMKDTLNMEKRKGFGRSTLRMDIWLKSRFLNSPLLGLSFKAASKITSIYTSYPPSKSWFNNLIFQFKFPSPWFCTAPFLSHPYYL